MSLNALVIFADDWDYLPPDVDLLREHLHQIGLFGDIAYPERGEHDGGSSFDSLITFASSHTIIELVPDGTGSLNHGPHHDSRNICLLKIETHPGKRNVLASPLTEIPACPACDWTAATLDDAFDLIGKAYKDDHFRFTCPRCGRTCKVPELNWRHLCGFSRCEIWIESIYPHEAAPSDKLLQDLKHFTGVPWEYCWYHL